MKGVSEIIAIIMILMITIAISGLAYTFMSSTMASTTSSASAAVDTTTSSMLTSFTIESMDVAKVYVRNTGQTSLSGLSVYINDVPAVFNITPLTIPYDQVGTITIYSFIAENDIVKIVSPNGFSASKKALDPCTKAIGCWKLDEGTGSTVYDSSPYARSGSTYSASWTLGRYGNAISVLGGSSGGYASVPTAVPASEYTIQFWFKLATLPAQQPQYAGFMGKGTSFSIEPFPDGRIMYSTYTGGSISYPLVNDLNWHVLTITRSSGVLRIYLDGILGNSNANGIVDQNSNYITIGRGWSYGFNGTIDEVRFYDRSIF